MVSSVPRWNPWGPCRCKGGEKTLRHAAYLSSSPEPHLVVKDSALPLEVLERILVTICQGMLRDRHPRGAMTTRILFTANQCGERLPKPPVREHDWKFQMNFRPNSKAWGCFPRLEVPELNSQPWAVFSIKTTVPSPQFALLSSMERFSNCTVIYRAALIH